MPPTPEPDANGDVPKADDGVPKAGDDIEGKYRVEAILGRGGMGAVVKARHLLRHAPVALKFLGAEARAHPGAEERFTNEAVAASRIDSEHVVKIFDVSRLPSGAPYLVMEYLQGGDLDTLRQREGPRLPVPRAVHLVLQILRALQTAHAAGVVHRDVKPANCIVLDKDGERDFVKVIDFGISKLSRTEQASRSLTETNVIFGTPLYMSPEQAQSSRDVDLRADLYSAGAILYELLSARTPFTDSGGNILHQLWTSTPEGLKRVCPDIPDALSDAVGRALAREPDDRFGSAVEMAQALAPFADARSAAVLGWLLGSRGRSLVPAGFASVRPPNAAAVASPEEASDKTVLPDALGVGNNRPASASDSPATGSGVARASAETPSGPRAAALSSKSPRVGLAAAAGAVAIALVAAGVYSSSSKSGGPSNGSPSAAPAQTPARVSDGVLSAVHTPEPAPAIALQDASPAVLPQRAPSPAVTPPHPGGLSARADGGPRTLHQAYGLE